MAPEAPKAPRVTLTEEDSLATWSTLLRRLRNTGDDISWRAFFETYWRLIYNVARKSGLSDADAQDVVQETVIAVARRMPEYCYDPAKGSFKQWLLLITRRRIHDHFRRAYRSVPTSKVLERESDGELNEVPSLEAGPDEQIDAVWEEEWRDHLLQSALARVRQKANPRQYQVFECCVLRNLPARDVARMFGLSAAQIYLTKHRMGLAVRRAVRELEKESNPADGRTNGLTRLGYDNP